MRISQKRIMPRIRILTKEYVFRACCSDRNDGKESFYRRSLFETWIRVCQLFMFRVIDFQPLCDIDGGLIQRFISSKIGIGGVHDRVEDLIRAAAEGAGLLDQPLKPRKAVLRVIK